jgi:translocator assembly and maintenance protein 41
VDFKDMLTENDAQDLLKTFPPVEFAFAYGSGVVEQGGYKYAVSDPSKLPMLDLILVVDNAEKWHAENKLRNNDHYTSLLPISAKLIARFQQRIPANLWFNAYVPMTIPKFSGRLMKYGVISKHDILDDLNKWSVLYTAGRLQKPVHILKPDHDIELAMQTNLESAVRTSLLMLPDKFEEVDLYLSIASLSYVGDPRMYVGENPKKVR